MAIPSPRSETPFPLVSDVSDHHIRDRESTPELHPSHRMGKDTLGNEDVVAHVTLTNLPNGVQELGITAKEGSDVEIEVVSDDEQGDDEDEEEEEDLQGSETLGSSTCRVTFRPRVRITSGLSRLRQHRLSTLSTLSNQDNPAAAFRRTLGRSPLSSRSCSPSSSISAPLRFHSEEPVSKPGWGTLGQRVSLLARRGEHKRRFRERMKRHERMLKSFQGDPYLGHTLNSPGVASYTETTPLLTARPICQCGIPGCEYDERRISQEIDFIFGPWPGRLLNPKWWWWHIQPIIFCRCLDDPDEDY